MYLIGITGNVACGKSLIGKLLQEKGFCVINVDRIAAQIRDENKKELCKRFPVLMENGEFSKEKLKNEIFNRGDSHQGIEKFIHRKVIFKTALKVLWEGLKGKRVIFIEIPLFMEYKLDLFLDSILVITDKHTQAKRIHKRDGSEYLVQKLQILGNQNYKKDRATFIIDNSKSIENTAKQLNTLVFNGMPIYFNIILFGFAVFSIKNFFKKIFKF